MAFCPVCNNELGEDDRTCSACGFHLLGATEQMEPIVLEEAPTSSKHTPKQKFSLRIVRGPSTGIDIELHEGTLSIGRDPRCDVFLNDMTVSRNHAEIEVGKEGCIIRDKNSVNGVWVNDRMVEACSLKKGDLIQIGSFCLTYHEI